MPAHNRAMPAREEGDACNHTSVPAPIEGRCLQIQRVMPAHSRAMPAREEGDACNHTSVPAPIEGRCL